MRKLTHVFVVGFAGNWSRLKIIGLHCACNDRMGYWMILYYTLFHMSTSHMPYYSRPTKNSHLTSQSPPHKTNTKPRDKQRPQNSHFSFLRNNTLTFNTPCLDRPMGIEASISTTSCCKKKKKTASC